MRAINIVFDGPPGPDPGRFIGVEDDNGKGIKVGEWLQDGSFWKLRIETLPGDIRINYSELWEVVDELSNYP